MAHAPWVERDCFLGHRVATCIFLAWGCGGNVTGSGRADASSTSDAAGTTVDGSSDGPNVDVLSDGPSVDGSGDAGVDTDSGTCMISASNYDQSCNVDSDCVQVSAGDYCSAATCTCGGSAINVGSMAQFNAAVAKTPLGSGALDSVRVVCGCPCESGAVCRSGKCQAAFCGAPSADTLPACADAGGQCAYSMNTTCNGTGPPECAYSDECCLK
jgi:hypothetical protein